jgi:hypothetical protein
MFTVRRCAGWVIIGAAVGLAGTGCDVNKALAGLSEARDLAADLHVQFAKAADASNRAVMAPTDESSVAFAREAEQAKQAIKKDSAALKPLLQTLGYSDESRLLGEFDQRFAAYATLDNTILEMAVENTNLKAQRLSFSPAQKEADTFRDALESVSADRASNWQVKALVAAAVAAVREIQALQAPHIAEADDAVMTRIDQRMATSATGARKALASLRPLVPPASRPKLADAEAALDRFMNVHQEITALSRRNTNVRSLVLSLTDKTKMTTACEESLMALRASLAKHGHRSSRQVIQ